MKMKRRESGLVVPDTPPEKPPEPPREYGPLEFRELEGRETLHSAFENILNSYGCQGRMFCQVDKLTAKAREDLVYFVARQLLGADWDCEILC